MSAGDAAALAALAFCAGIGAAVGTIMQIALIAERDELRGKLAAALEREVRRNG